MRPALAVGSLAGVIASAVALVASGRMGEGTPQPAALPPGLSSVQRTALLRAAEASGGRRVLVLRGRRGTPRTAEVLEAARSAEGWSLFAAAPDDGGAFAGALAELAARARREWSADTGLPPATVRALELLDVKVVLVDAVDGAEVPGRLAPDAGLAPAPGGLFLRVTRAEPVARVAGEVTGSADPAALVASLRPEPASILDPEDSLWGGAVTVDAPTPGRYVFAWPPEAESVTVDGRPASPVPGSALLVLDLPAGRSRVEVRWRTADARGWIVVASVGLLVVSLAALFVALRPAPVVEEAPGGPESA